MADVSPRNFFDRVTDSIENSLPDIWWDDVKPLVPAGRAGGRTNGNVTAP